MHIPFRSPLNSCSRAINNCSWAFTATMQAPLPHNRNVCCPSAMHCAAQGGHSQHCPPSGRSWRWDCWLQDRKRHWLSIMRHASGLERCKSTLMHVRLADQLTDHMARRAFLQSVAHAPHTTSLTSLASAIGTCAAMMAAAAKPAMATCTGLRRASYGHSREFGCRIGTSMRRRYGHSVQSASVGLLQLRQSSSSGNVAPPRLDLPR